MLSLRKITTSDSKYDFVENLFLEAFPEDERRDLADQCRNIDANPDFSLILAEDDGKAVGFITLWDFKDFYYCEHFATSPATRNRGYGGKIISQVLEQLNAPLVLEVELPTDDRSRRRIDFYTRHGFHLWDTIPYTQPPYRPSGHPLPMHLMTADKGLTIRNLNKVIDLLHAHVYGQSQNSI